MCYLSKIVAIVIAAAFAAPAPARAGIMDFDCAYLEGNEFLKAAGRSAPDRAACLAGAGFLEEARGALRERPAREKTVLRDVIALLLGDAAPGRDHLIAAAWGSPEAAFWLLAAETAPRRDVLDSRARNRATAFFIGAPDWVKARYGVPFAASLIALDDSANALQAADALDLSSGEARKAAFANPANFIRGAVYQDQGAVKEAVAFYARLSAPWNDPLVIEARLRRVALLWSTGAIKSADAVSLLEELDRDWQGDALGARIRLALARAYVFSDRLYESFLVLDRLAQSSAPEDYRTEARRRLKHLALEAFTSRAHESALIAQIDMHRRFKSYSLAPDERLAFDVAAAAWFASSGLHSLAAEILDPYGPEMFAGAGAMTVLAAAETLIAIHQPARAAEIAAGLDPAFLTDAGRDRLALLRARLAPPAAPADEAPRAVAAAIAQEAWRQGLWRVYHAAAAGAGDSTLPEFPRRIAAAYLARGARLAADAENDFSDQPILAALAAAEKVEAASAADLRALLAGAGAVLALEPLLSPSANPLADTEQPDPSPSIEQG